MTVKTGEPLRRPLKYLGDKGNDFEIKVIYYYYSVDLEAEETDEEIEIPFETWLFVILPLICVILATAIYLLWDWRKLK